MVLYKYTRKQGINYIPAYSFDDTVETDTVVKYMDTDSILSEMEPIDMDGTQYVYCVSDGLLYPFYLNGKELFTKSTCVDSMVASSCKVGLSIYDSVNNGQEIYKLAKGDHVLLNMAFTTDKNENLWASVSVLGDDLTLALEKGYLIYKNNRNNFLNLVITDAEYSSVVTSGVIDNAKVEAVKQQSNIMLLSNSKNNLSTITTSIKKDKNGNTYTYQYKKGKATAEQKYIDKIASHAPSIVQNDSNYPKSLGQVNGIYQYDYTIDCSKIKGIKKLSDLRKVENMDANTIKSVFNKSVTYYNRFKVALPDETLSRGFMHVFFTRPDCNLLNESGSGLLTNIKNDPSLFYLYKRKPKLVKELVLDNGMSHDYLMLLSNKANNFTVTDEGITADKYGKTFGGYTVAFGRRKDSELGGTFDISYTDTRDLDILNLHKLWIDYINNVYRGKWVPKTSYIYNKIIDYACSVYVVLTAEDFETIIFWTKYYGVFPVNVPYNALSWTSGAPISKPEISVTYNYSWKEDMNPLTLTELNVNTFRKNKPKKITYSPSWNPKHYHAGYTWVGAPFVETIKYDSMTEDLTNGSKVVSKLRFRQS